MTTMVFDIETNGFLDVTNRVHCLSVKVHEGPDAGKVFRFRENEDESTIGQGVRFLESADCIVGHNIIKFDIPALKKVYPWFNFKGLVRDTLVMAKLIWTNIKDFDGRNMHKGFPSQFYGKHSLEAWGYRLGNRKGDFKGPWDQWTQEMDDYCAQDSDVTDALLTLIESKNYSPEAIQLEHDVQRIIWRQEQNGVTFNEEEAGKLYGTLKQIQQDIATELKQIFKPWYKADKGVHPKRDNIKMGYRAGCPMTKVKLLEFNPSSGAHIADRLIKEHGWKPKEFTETGLPKVDESVLSKLKYPFIPTLVKYLTVNKRIGQLAEGDEAWLKHVKNGKIHGGVNTNGAVTGRMTHSKPNLGQVPSVDHLWGVECRALFIARLFWRLVGADASGLELRCLAHYMAKYDGGAYGRVLLEGDIHTFNRIALGFPEGNEWRQVAKRFIYAFLYGAGDELLGEISGKGGKKAGKALRATFLANLPALGSLIGDVKDRAESRKYLIGLDGRRLHVRSPHSALNTLLQSAGAVVMKKALVILNETLGAKHLAGDDWEFCLNVHDEWQIECKPEIAETVGKTAVDAIRLAGEYFKFRIPLSGEWKEGNNWAETH